MKTQHRALATILSCALCACIGSDDLGLDMAPEDHPIYAELRSRLAITVRFHPDDADLSLGECSELLDRSKPCCGLSYCSAVCSSPNS